MKMNRVVFASMMMASVAIHATDSGSTTRKVPQLLSYDAKTNIVMQLITTEKSGLEDSPLAFGLDAGRSDITVATNRYPYVLSRTNATTGMNHTPPTSSVIDMFDPQTIASNAVKKATLGKGRKSAQIFQVADFGSSGETLKKKEQLDQHSVFNNQQAPTWNEWLKPNLFIPKWAEFLTDETDLQPDRNPGTQAVTLMKVSF